MKLSTLFPNTWNCFDIRKWYTLYLEDRQLYGSIIFGRSSITYAAADLPNLVHKQAG